jgi:hypothetical protein
MRTSRLAFLVTALSAFGCQSRAGGSGGGDGGGIPDRFIAVEDLSGDPRADFSLADLAKLHSDGLSAADLGSASVDLAAVSDLGHSDAGALDPALSLPAASGTVCYTPGSSSGCALASVCRPFSATEGRCESCTNCGHLNALCQRSDECDIVFTCYQHRCTGFCMLGMYGCAGGIAGCVNIGHPVYGVCQP